MTGISLDLAQRRARHIALPTRLPQSGANTVSARFATPMVARGAAIIRFRDDNDRATYLYTPLGSSNANLLFPCFDRPDNRAGAHELAIMVSRLYRTLSRSRRGFSAAWLGRQDSKLLRRPPLGVARCLDEIKKALQYGATKATTTVLDRYMVKRPGSTMWQLRKPVPADVQLAFGRSVVTKSLGTSNDRDATKAALALLDELEEHWAEIRSKGATKGSRPAARSPDSGEPPTHAKHAVIRAAYEQVRLRFDAHYDSLHLADPEAHRRGTERRRLEAAELQRQVRRGELQRFESPTAKQLAKLGYDAEYESDWFHMLVREFATAVLDAQEVALRIDEGHLDPKPTTDVVRRAIRNDDPTVSLSTTSFSTLAEQLMKQWLAGRSGEKQTNTEQQKRATLRLFGGFFGDRSISEVRPEHAAEFFDKVRLFDPNWARSPEARKLSWPQLVERYGDRPRGLSDGTMNRHLQVLQEIWAWARKRGHCAGENPFEGFHKKLRAGVNVKPYVAWENDELRQLLTPPPKRSDLLEIVLVGMFTGMRLDEIASLTWSQLQESAEEGVTIPYFQVEDAKTPAGNRKVPVHQDLRWLLSRERGKADERLWPKFNEEGAGKKPGNDAGREFSRYKASKGFNDRSKAFHSFRKNVTRMMERAGVPENDWAQIFGHERGFTYRVYNPDGINMARRAEIISLICYNGIEIPHPPR